MFRFFHKPKLRETTLKIKITVFIEKDEDGFIAHCPELKGLIADGDSEDKVLENFAHASHAYFMSLLKHDDPLPMCTTIKTKDIPAHSVTRDVEVPLDVLINNNSNNNCLIPA